VRLKKESKLVGEETDASPPVDEQEEEASVEVAEHRLIISKYKAGYKFEYHGMTNPSQALRCLDLAKKDLMIQLNRGTFDKKVA
jgi:hypothetical protein